MARKITKSVSSDGASVHSTKNLMNQTSKKFSWHNQIFPILVNAKLHWVCTNCQTYLVVCVCGPVDSSISEYDTILRYPGSATIWETPLEVIPGAHKVSLDIERGQMMHRKVKESDASCIGIILEDQVNEDHLEMNQNWWMMNRIFFDYETGGYRSATIGLVVSSPISTRRVKTKEMELNTYWSK